MNIIFSNDSNKPIYRQLFERISSQVIRGELKGDTLLPPIRTAAKELRVSIITVKKAWEDLERNGFIYTIAGKGCFISNYTSKQLEEIKQALIYKQLLADLKYYKDIGATKENLIENINMVYKL